MKQLLLFVICVVLITSCRTAKTVQESNTNISQKTAHLIKTDSIYVYQRDSIFVKQKGDSILYYKFITRFRDRFKTDTLFITRIEYKNKEIIVKSPPEKIEVPKKLNFKEKVLIKAGYLFFIVLGITILFVSIKFRGVIIKILSKIF